MGLIYLVPMITYSEYVCFERKKTLTLVYYRGSVLLRRSLDFQMASEHERRLRVGDAVPHRSHAAHVDALRVESLQGPARRTRRARSASAEQIAVLLVSDKREGRHVIMLNRFIASRINDRFVRLFILVSQFDAGRVERSPEDDPVPGDYGYAGGMRDVRCDGKRSFLLIYLLLRFKAHARNNSLSYVEIVTQIAVVYSLNVTTWSG